MFSFARNNSPDMLECRFQEAHFILEDCTDSQLLFLGGQRSSQNMWNKILEIVPNDQKNFWNSMLTPTEHPSRGCAMSGSDVAQSPERRDQHRAVFRAQRLTSRSLQSAERRAGARQLQINLRYKQQA
eukprot:6194607-Pleurochrysis_carterae.AAC.2